MRQPATAADKSTSGNSNTVGWSRDTERLASPSLAEVQCQLIERRVRAVLSHPVGSGCGLLPRRAFVVRVQTHVGALPCGAYNLKENLETVVSLPRDYVIKVKRVLLLISARD